MGERTSANDPSSVSGEATVPAAGTGTAPTGGAPADATAQIDAHLAALVGAFGDRLDEAARATLRERLEANADRAAKMRAYPLGYFDAPDSVFRPARPAGRRDGESSAPAGGAAGGAAPGSPTGASAGGTGAV